MFWQEQIQQDSLQLEAQVANFNAGSFQSPTPLPPPDDITLLFVGDIMLDRGVEAKIKQRGDWRWPLLKIADALKTTDLAFGNLESQISDKGKKIGTIYSFRADPQTIEGLVYAGFDVLSVANNHTFDYGREAFEDSLSRLKSAGIDYVGGGFSSTEVHAPLVKQIDETRVAFLAYSNFVAPFWIVQQQQSGIALADWSTLETVKGDVAQAKSQADIVVVSLHAGEEYTKEPTDFQKKFAQIAIDAGADLVVGHHPHVAQPVEQYNNGWIAYSLGNFIFDQDFSKETMEGLMLKVIIENNKIKEVRSLKTKINPDFQVELLTSE